MIPGLNARHQWNGGLILNDKSVWPLYRLRRLPGLHTRPDGEDNRDVPPGRPYRELPRSSMLHGKSVVYEGQIEARSQTDLAAARKLMLETFVKTEEGTMLLMPYGGGQNYQYTARVTALDIPEETPSHRHARHIGFMRGFTLGLRMSDPRFYEPNWNSLDGDFLPPAGGGLVLPAALPAPIPSGGLVYGGVSIDAGTVPTDPIMDLFGPLSSPITVTNVTHSRSIVITGLPVNDGQRLEIDFAARTLRLNGSTDVRKYMNPDLTNWWDRGFHGLEPGVNHILLRSTAPLAAPTRIQVRWRKAALA